MIDQSRLDLLTLIDSDLRWRASTGGGEYAGMCPFCGGRDRFRVWPNANPPRWWCRRCERQGDAIGFVQQREQVSFKEALRLLGLQGHGYAYRTRSPAPPPPAPPPPPSHPPGAAWQAAARAFVAQATTALQGDDGKPLAWLQRRGFTAATITRAGIGYHARDQYVPRATWGLPDLAPTTPGGKPRTHLWLPRGIVIPWFVAGELWKVFIRRPIPPDAWEAVRPLRGAAPTGPAAPVLQALRAARGWVTVRTVARQCGLAVETVQAALATLDALGVVQRPTKHYQVPGGSNALYNADAIQAGRPLILVEAALDALALQQEAGDLCAAVATGTTGGRTVRWIGQVLRASVVLLAFDHDAGGAVPTVYWQDVLRQRARVWRPPIDDPAAMLERGLDVRGWITAGLHAHEDGSRAGASERAASPTAVG